jgi:hypothetical protein
MTLIVVALKRPEVVKSEEMVSDWVALYPEKHKFTVQSSPPREYAIPENMDVVILWGSATARLLKKRVYDYFVNLGDKVVTATDSGTELKRQLHNGNRKAWKDTSTEEIKKWFTRPQLLDFVAKNAISLPSNPRNCNMNVIIQHVKSTL